MCQFEHVSVMARFIKSDYVCTKLQINNNSTVEIVDESTYKASKDNGFNLKRFILNKQF